MVNPLQQNNVPTSDDVFPPMMATTTQPIPCKPVRTLQDAADSDITGQLEFPFAEFELFGTILAEQTTYRNMEVTMSTHEETMLLEMSRPEDPQDQSSYGWLTAEPAQEPTDEAHQEPLPIDSEEVEVVEPSQPVADEPQQLPDHGVIRLGHTSKVDHTFQPPISTKDDAFLISHFLLGCVLGGGGVALGAYLIGWL